MIKAKIKQLQEKRAGLLTRSEEIRMKYQGEKSANMDAQEEEEWTNILNEVDSIQKQVENLEKEEAILEWGKGIANPLNRNIPGKDGEILDAAVVKGMGVFNRFLKSGYMSLRPDDLAALGAITSIKAYQADDPAGGGFLVTPQQFANDFLTLMKNLVFMRRLSKVIPLVRAESVGVPSIDVDPSDADWTTELGTGSEESTMKFGKRELKPSPMAKRIKLSMTLLRRAPQVEGIVQDRLGYKVGITEEKGFLVGTGANQPLGVFTPSANGISTGRDVAAAAAAALAGDDFINVKYSLKPQYLTKAEWILNRSVVKEVRKLKDTTGNYLWTSGVGVTGPGGGLQGTSERLLDLPINQSEYAPGTVATGNYVGILGNFDFYWIADALDMQIQVLDQLYAETNQMGYILRKETDGMPVLEEAFARLKMA